MTTDEIMALVRQYGEKCAEGGVAIMSYSTPADFRAQDAEERGLFERIREAIEGLR